MKLPKPKQLKSGNWRIQLQIDGEAPKPVLSPEGVETIITENILYENTFQD